MEVERLRKEKSENERLRIDWHSGFAGGLELSFRQYRDQITIEREHLLGKKPLQMDFLLIKKTKDVIINNSVGRAFSGHNIIEYKSPDDGLSISDIWKVIGYAGIYIALGRTADEISADDITITIFRSRYPGKLFKQLKEQKKEVTNPYPGVFSINGIVELPIQIVVTDMLSDEDFQAIKILKRNVDISELKSFILQAATYDVPGDLEDAKAVLRVILESNRDFWKDRRDSAMKDIIQEIFKDEFTAAEEKIKELEADNKELKANNIELEADKKELEADKKELEAENKKLKEQLALLGTK